MSAESVLIREYRVCDRQAVRQICCDTAFMGEPCSAFFDGQETFADALTGYFTDCEPHSCFVAELDGQIAGYLIGAVDVLAIKGAFARKILPGLLVRAVSSGALIRPKNIRFLGRLLRSMLKGEFSQPDFSKEYPATLHISVRKGLRGMHIGSRLLGRYLEYLKGKDVAAVHIATMSDEGARFFEGQGFKLLFRAPRSYFRNLLGRDIEVCTYGRRIA